MPENQKPFPVSAEFLGDYGEGDSFTLEVVSVDPENEDRMCRVQKETPEFGSDIPQDVYPLERT